MDEQRQTRGTWHLGLLELRPKLSYPDNYPITTIATAYPLPRQLDHPHKPLLVLMG